MSIKDKDVVYVEYIYTIDRILFIPDKEGNPTIWDNIDRSWGYFPKWNESDRERQINTVRYHLNVEY